MKKLLAIIIAASTLMLSCSDDDDETPLVADFSASIVGESPNAELVIINNSTGASSYSWEFSEGASVATSTDQTPSEITIDKAGNFEITLTAISGSNEDQSTTTLSINGNSAILEFSDVEFGIEEGDATYGRFFSIEDGVVYTDSQISEENGASVNITFGSFGSSVNFFESPASSNFYIPNATETYFINYQSEVIMTADDFDAMDDDEELSEFTVTQDDGEGFSSNSIPNVILFQTEAGRKGAIKTKNRDSERLLVDIKVQKY
ncbi:hypothetical protein LVD15_14500 [Fulvivirga maritima]|uniref:PKD domain-containing protein n=1 Tax=Fulvivirga maritima TaxID=2904247 RepID=UPI001F3C33EC|nr:hypothetical protein [Fulvivirga maritima]UII24533.1 hypothetical protein LVD15_14500 [Fulvivirga maritima]